MKPFIAIIITVFFASCQDKEITREKTVTPESNNRIALTKEQEKNARITSGSIEKKMISSLLKVNGRIDVPPQNRTSVSVPLGGYLRSTKLLPGMEVRKGDVIAVVEDQQYIQLQQDYLTAVSQLAFQEKEYSRQKELNASKASSDKIFQQAEADYRSQRILVKSLSERLKLTGIDPEKLNESNLSRSVNVLAPIDGFVSAVNVNIGKYVTPSEVMFELINSSDIHLTLTLFERDLGKIYIGQKVDAYTNHDPEKRYRCEVILISQNVDNDRSAEIHCHFERYDQALKPGMYMNAEIHTTTDSAFVLPDEAVVLFENKHYIFKEVSAGTFEMQEVTTGASENGFTQISSDIDPDARYVVKGAYSVLMALKNSAVE